MTSISFEFLGSLASSVKEKTHHLLQEAFEIFFFCNLSINSDRFIREAIANLYSIQPNYTEACWR
jgi:hypothetical protein